MNFVRFVFQEVAFWIPVRLITLVDEGFIHGVYTVRVFLEKGTTPQDFYMLQNDEAKQFIADFKRVLEEK